MAPPTRTAADGDRRPAIRSRQGEPGHHVDGERAICPLCGVQTGDARSLYVHLQTGHRKSTLAGMVLRG